MKSIIKQTAKYYGVSVKEVRKELTELIITGMTSAEPDASAFWSQFCGKAPTPEQLIYVLSSMALAENTSSGVDT